MEPGKSRTQSDVVPAVEPETELVPVLAVVPVDTVLVVGPVLKLVPPLEELVGGFPVTAGCLVTPSVPVEVELVVVPFKAVDVVVKAVMLTAAGSAVEVALVTNGTLAGGGADPEVSFPIPHGIG